MDNYWEAPTAELVEEPYEESGRPGCLSVLAVLLAISGLVYGVILSILGLDLIVDQPQQLAEGAMVTFAAGGGSLLAVILALGLWRLRLWAWWLAVILQSVGIGLTLLGFGAALLGRDPMRALGFVLGPLMGLVASGIILYWFLTNRERFGQDGRIVEGSQVVKETESDSTLLIIAVVVIAAIALLCLTGLVLALIFVLGFPIRFFPP